MYRVPFFCFAAIEYASIRNVVRDSLKQVFHEASYSPSNGSLTKVLISFP